MIKFSTIIKEFLQHCKIEKNLSDKTIKAYETDIMQLNNFFCSKNYDPYISQITKNELREFLISISHLKPKSIKRKIACLKVLFNYLEFEDKIIVSPFRKLKINIKEPKRLPSVMNIMEIKSIFQVAYKRKNNINDTLSYPYFCALRDIVIIELLFSTGARVSELSDLKETSLNFDTGNIIIKGKGDKERIIQVCNKETLMLMRQYRKQYLSKIESSNNYFFINRFNKRLSDQSIRTIVKQLSNKAEIKRHITPHVFRHSFATLLLENGVDIKYIQILLGHSSILTTQIYTHVNSEKQKQILKTKHPRKDFSMLLPLCE